VNGLHRWFCGSARWARTVEDRLLPWALSGVELGPDVLELGPGRGVTTRLLAARVPRLTAVEVDAGLATRLKNGLGEPPGHQVRVVHADATSLPFAGETFSGVVCFTMLHHVPSAEQQDRLFAEAHRVLRPGGVVAGSDSQLSLLFRLVHLGDTMVVVDPATLGQRLARAGFESVRVSTARGVVRFTGHRR
jgi:SAM-dependent methyltransferase